MSHERDLEGRLTAAKEAVLKACAVCRAVQRELESVRSSLKDDRSPVTVADWASQAVIAHTLRERLGGIVIVGEEETATLRQADHAGHRAKVLEAVRIVWEDATEADVLEAIDLGGQTAAAKEHEVFWTLDPIDGTKGFLRGEQYAVSLAFIQGGAPTLGVLGCPNLAADLSEPFETPDSHGTIYFGYRGSGVWEAPADHADAEAVHIRRLEPAEGEPLRICESVEAEHSKQADTARILAMVGETGEPARLDSQAKYAVVARGQAEAYLRMPTRKGYVEKIWDHAAGVVIAEEAGCAVTDIRGRSLDFSQGFELVKNHGIVCAPPRVHGKLLGAIESLGLAEG